MGKLIDLTGKRFGRLTVIRRSYPNQGIYPMWLCRCDCGNEKIINGGSLRSEHTKSCGCLIKEYIDKIKLKLGLATMHRLINVYKRSAKIRGIEYKLTEKQFANLTQRDCHYCGAKPSNIHIHKDTNGDYIYNGLDRVNNNKGYIINNVVPCCKRCNRAKRNFTLEDFKDWIEKIYDNFSKRR